jgi:F-type H+-transporting ATPase subunit a
MSAITVPAPAGTPAEQKKPGMSKGKKIGLSVAGLWFAGLVFFIGVFGFKSHKNIAITRLINPFAPTDEFKLDTWFKLGPIDINKGVLYVLLAGIITIAVLFYVSRRLQQKPGRMQVAVEGFYSLTRGMARENLDDPMTKKYFPLIATIFVFILVTNLMGYIPLPVDSSEKFSVFGAMIPSFQIYAADTNVAFPLILALLVFVLFTYERLKDKHGPIGFAKSLIPDGLPKAMVPPIFGIEVLSYFLRLISLTVRLWANLLAGHMLIAFMGGELGVLVGDAWVQWLLLPFGIAIFMFEAVLIAGLQAFIFSILTAIYLGDAVSSH